MTLPSFLRRPLRSLALLSAGLLVASAQAQTPPQGVTANEVLLGTIADLSGPVAPYGRDVRNGLQMAIAEINARGGIHGRQLRLLVEDHGYDPKRSVLSAQKLVNQDKVFGIVGTFGTPHSLAAMQVMFPKGVFSLFPMALARETYEPLNPLKFAMLPASFEQIAPVVPGLYRERKATRACVLYQDDDFGHEVLGGTEAGLKTVGATLVERASYKRGATDFSSQVARLKAANCDFVVLGTIIRETVGVITEARKLGFSPTFLVSSTGYSELIPRLGGKDMDGLYAVHTAAHPYPDDVSAPVADWAKRYQAQFQSAPTIFSVYGYTKITLIAKALERAGPQLTTEGFTRAMEGVDVPGDIFGNPPMRFSATQHLGSSRSRLSQLQNGRWKVVLDYDQFR